MLLVALFLDFAPKDLDRPKSGTYLAVFVRTFLFHVYVWVIRRSV